MVHKGKSNEYDLKDNSKKIMISPMSSTEVWSMNNKKPSLTMLASEKEVKKVLNKKKEIYVLLRKKT